MNKVLSVYFVALCIQEILAGCPEYVFKMVSIRDFLANDFLETHPNFSVHQCAEQCVNVDGDSFSYNTETKSCFIHRTRVSHGHTKGSHVQGMVVYWRESNECPATYVYNDTHNVCYKIYKDYKTWMDAATICEGEQAVLIVASESWKYDLLLQIYTDVKNALQNAVVFVGGNNKTETTWKWMDGTAVTNWANGEPNSNIFNIELCAAIKQDAGNDHRLMDIGCFRTQHFICEVPMRKKL